jgi:ribosomal protein S12 methylthiotransferase accessory factor
MENYKTYKQSSPIDTIYRIKGILKNIGILTKDIHYGQFPCYSCRVSIGNSELSSLNIGTNGKGRSFEYSMASGYAEFLERLQNHILLSMSKKQYATKKYLNKLSLDSMFVKNINEKHLTLGYVYDNNEEVWNMKEILSESENDLLRLFSIDNKEELHHFFLNELKLEEATMVPFFSVKNNEERLLPIEMVMAATASNGMCAGNTREEALVQGFCEIFERYAAKQLYYKEITPPDIPLSCFEDTPIYDVLVYLKNNLNYEIIVKDCSLQQGFPVIGILFIDHINQTYNFKLGADFIPYIALERCITEILQGKNNVPSLPIKFIDLKTNPTGYPIEKSIDYNYQKIFINHSGYWPFSLFSDKPSYKFEGFNDLYGKSDIDDLKHSINLISNLGYNTYIRDNSILDFPTYYIVIPGISQIINDKEQYNFFKKTFTEISVKELYSINTRKARLLADAIDDNYYLLKYFNYDYTNLYMYNIDEELLGLEIELLAFMLFYYIGEIIQAKKYLDVFLEYKEKEKSLYAYYFAISDFITLKYFKNLSVEETKSILKKCYGSTITEDVISAYIDPANSFEHFHFPNCFNCENCPVRKTCSYVHMLIIHKKIHEIAEKNQIEQIKLREIL